MRIVFVLPGGAPQPIGGFKVVYEYANALAHRDHDVTVVHPAYASNDFSWYSAVRSQLLSYPIKGLMGLWRPDRWFAMDPRVRMLWVPALRAELLPDADAVVATWWRTAELVSALPSRKGRKYYLIQHLETWGGPRQRVLATWKLPLKKIVIARWLRRIASELGERCHYIPNGLNFDAFGIDSDPADRDSFSVAMLYHELAWKGSRNGVEALHLAKESVPKLRVELFGTSGAVNLPEWISYTRDPPQAQLRALYNRAAIFVAPSWTEGWPLPPAEALMCGCALACTEIGGHLEYAIEGRTALLSPPRDPTALARSIVAFATDNSLRLRVAEQGNRMIRQFTWQRAVERLERVLCCDAEEPGDEPNDPDASVR